MSEIIRLALSHGAIHTVEAEGEPHVVFRPAVEAIGLDYSTQLRKLRDRSWANRRDIPTVAEDGKTRQMIAVDVRTFLMWLATVNENKVAESVRPVLVAYQNETTSAVHNYWVKGVAANPRAVHPASPTTVSWEQAAAIARLQHGLDVNTDELRELLNKGGILTNTGRPHKKWEHLFWPLATRWEVHLAVLPQLIGFAAQVRHQLAAAERSLQMSLPFPIAGLVRDAIEGGAS